LGFAFQSIGLQYTTASKSGFLLYLNVKLVPLLAFVLLGRPVSASTMASAVAAFLGTFLLATNGRSLGAMVARDGGDGTGLNVGDAWSVAAAAASAMFILRLERAALQVPDAAALNAACLWMVALLSGLWIALPSFGPFHADHNPTVLADILSLLRAHGPELLYLSVVTTALANWIQTIAQRNVPAERASIIYAMDPVYGAAFAHFWLGENLAGPAAWAGAALITAAAAANALLDLQTNYDEPR
jgi:drug/metabolite transporter (DMT)-like permease